MTVGDWDLDGRANIIVVGPEWLATLDPESGQTQHTFKGLAGVGSKPPAESPAGKQQLQYSPYDSVQLHWTEVAPGRAAWFQLKGGWTVAIPIRRADCSIQWTHTSEPGIDDAAWVDLRGDGRKALVVGYNAHGIEAVDENGLLWSDDDLGNVWTVVGIDAKKGRPGVVVCSARQHIAVLDSRGKRLATIEASGLHFGAAEMNATGLRQVIAVTSPPAGKWGVVRAFNLNGKSLWTYPVQPSWIMKAKVRPFAEDIDGDGTRDWIVYGSRQELSILDTQGRLLARLPGQAVWWRSLTAVTREGQPGLLITADDKQVTAWSMQVETAPRPQPKRAR